MQTIIIIILFDTIIIFIIFAPLKQLKLMIMKLTKTGYRLNKNGNPISTIENDALTSNEYLGEFIKKNGNYYYFERKQGNIFIYLLG